jgi:trimeric autotransporter adhesin
LGLRTYTLLLIYQVDQTSGMFPNNQLNEDLGEFKPVNDNFFEQDEQENRMEFDLSVNRNDLSNDNNKTRQSVGGDESGGDGSSGKNSSGEKWWNNINNMLQNSKLEVSNMSMLSNTTLNLTSTTATTTIGTTNNNLTSQLSSSSMMATSTTTMTSKIDTGDNTLVNNNKRNIKSSNDTNLEHSPTKRHKHKVDVAVYFGGKSQMPPELNKKGKENESNWGDDATRSSKIADCVETLPTTSNLARDEKSTIDVDKTPVRATAVDEDTTLNMSQTNNGSMLPSDPYNFTINLSVNGDAIIPIKGAKVSETTPFVMTKNEQKNAKSTSINLKSIGQELDRVQSRLATSSLSSKTRATLTSSTSSSSLISSSASNSSKYQMVDPLLSSSSIKSSHSTTNLKSLMNMDETVSSINSSNVTTSSSSSSYTKKSKSNTMGSSKISKKTSK